MNHRRILAWADRHLKRAEREVEAFWENHPWNTRLQGPFPAVEEIGKLCRRPGVPHRLSSEVALTIGDAIHNMRVSLDWLAFRLATRNSIPANERDIGFPIYDASSKYRQWEPRKLAGVDPTARQLIEKMQPYHAKPSDPPHPLRLLEELDTVYKHRRLIDTQPAVTSIRYKVKGRGSLRSIWTIPTPSGPLKNGAIVIRAIKDDAETHVQYRTRFHPCFAQIPALKASGGANVIRTLKTIRNYIRRDVFRPLQTYAK